MKKSLYTGLLVLAISILSITSIYAAGPREEGNECYSMRPHMDCGNMDLRECITFSEENYADPAGSREDSLISKVVYILDDMDIYRFGEEKLDMIRDRAYTMEQKLHEELIIEPTGGGLPVFDNSLPQATAYMVAKTVSRYITEYIGDDCMPGNMNK